LIDPEKLGKRPERSAQFAKAGRAGRFFVIIIKGSVLGAREPGDVERAQVAGGEIRPYGHER
jgi:hypothetical protein